MLPVSSRSNGKGQPLCAQQEPHPEPFDPSDIFPPPWDGGRPSGAPLDHPRNHSPHYRVRRRDCDPLDDRHHRLDSGRNTRAARDGRSRGRRPQALLLSAPPGSSRSLIMLSSNAATGPFGWMSGGACRSEDPEFFFRSRPMAPRCARSTQPKQSAGHAPSAPHACPSACRPAETASGAEPPPKSAVPCATTKP